MKKVLAATAFSVFATIGALQPETAVGNASLAAVETVLDLVVSDALACPGGNGGGNGKGNGGGNRGGNGKGKGGVQGGARFGR